MTTIPPTGPVPLSGVLTTFNITPSAPGNQHPFDNQLRIGFDNFAPSTYYILSRDFNPAPFGVPTTQPSPYYFNMFGTYTGGNLGERLPLGGFRGLSWGYMNMTTSSGLTSVPRTLTYKYAVIGGGGGGGGASSLSAPTPIPSVAAGGGGGGGGVVTGTVPLTGNSPFPVTVGTGGNGGANSGASGGTGTSSSAPWVTVGGGGGGGGASPAGTIFAGNQGGAYAGGGGGGARGSPAVYGAASPAPTNGSGFAGAAGGASGGGGGGGSLSAGNPGASPYPINTPAMIADCGAPGGQGPLIVTTVYGVLVNAGQGGGGGGIARNYGGQRGGSPTLPYMYSGGGSFNSSGGSYNGSSGVASPVTNGTFPYVSGGYPSPASPLLSPSNYWFAFGNGGGGALATANAPGPGFNYTGGVGSNGVVMIYYP